MNNRTGLTSYGARVNVSSETGSAFLNLIVKMIAAVAERHLIRALLRLASCSSWGLKLDSEDERDKAVDS